MYINIGLIRAFIRYCDNEFQYCMLKDNTGGWEGNN